MCEGKDCGEDGCGGDCGACSKGVGCTEAGKCGVPPDDLGDKCAYGTDCTSGVCVTAEPSLKICTVKCADIEKCPDNYNCKPDIANNLVCWPDCVPDCDGKECGEDGCGGVCGDGCGEGFSCQEGMCQPDVPVMPTSPGDVFITELMAHPGNDDKCEWFELYNPGPVEFELQGCTIGDKQLVEENTPHSIAQSVPVAAGGYVVIGRKAPDDVPACQVDVAYAYPSGIQLNNKGDLVQIACGDELVGGQVIDEVSFDQSWGFKGPSNLGLSLQLTVEAMGEVQPHIANDVLGSWCWAPKIEQLLLGVGLWGSPGGETKCQ